jgi:hypothetical protein
VCGLLGILKGLGDEVPEEDAVETVAER